ncbi:MAG: sel1 repeat family protein [Alloprevotella sp.]|nr:sel1 repeat family protein [Alloprevotella sp.]
MSRTSSMRLMLMAVMVQLATGFFSNLALGDELADVIEKVGKSIRCKYKSELVIRRENEALAKILDDPKLSKDEKIKAIKKRFLDSTPPQTISSSELPRLRKEAEKENVEAQCKLGVCYENGDGVAKDLTEAVKWCRKAAEQGDAAAQYDLGGCYYNGLVVAQDLTEAVKWFTKAAEQGYAAAQHCLGVCYYNGNGVTKDLAKAVKWYRKAAEQGYAAAQCDLGWCYVNGEGVPMDLTEAVKWCRKAAEQGDEEAQTILRELGY